jgi:hypothetical protein
MFQLTDNQREKVCTWSAEQDKKVIEQQKGTGLEHPGMPYYGASGGALTYSFTPTSLGMILKVEHNLTHETIDLTEYSYW